MPLKFAYPLSILLALFFLSPALEAGGMYDWTGDECLSDSGDSAYVGKRCKTDADCPDDLQCISPDASGGFCSLNCKTDSDCGHASECLLSSLDEQPLCIPTACPDDREWPDHAECSAKLAADETESENSTHTRKECKTVCACDQSQGVDYGAASAIIILMTVFFGLRLRSHLRKKAC